jgi:hypothetical protein
VGAMLINVAIGLSDHKIKLLDEVIGLGTLLTVENTALGIVGVMVFLNTLRRSSWSWRPLR